MKSSAFEKIFICYLFLLSPVLFFEYQVIPRLHVNDTLLLSHEVGVSDLDSYLRKHLGYGFRMEKKDMLTYALSCKKESKFDDAFYSAVPYESLCSGFRTSTTYDFGWINIEEIKKGNGYKFANLLMQKKGKKDVVCTPSQPLISLLKMQSSVHACEATEADTKEKYYYRIIFLYPAKIKSVVPVIIIGDIDNKKVDGLEFEVMQKITYIFYP